VEKKIMGASITEWENAAAYFTFADNPLALVLFSIGVASIIVGVIASIKHHEDKAFDKYKDK